MKMSSIHRMRPFHVEYFSLKIEYPTISSEEPEHKKMLLMIVFLNVKQNTNRSDQDAQSLEQKILTLRNQLSIDLELFSLFQPFENQ